MDWRASAGRVVIEACSPHPDDVVLLLGWGDGEVARGLAERVRRVVVRDPGDAPPDLPAGVSWSVGDVRTAETVEGLSVVAIHWELRRLPPDQQAALVRRVAAILPARGLFVVGDLLWSLGPEMVDEPEQYGDALRWAPRAADFEKLVRSAGFLPDLHRLGPAVGVMIALKAGR